MRRRQVRTDSPPRSLRVWVPADWPEDDLDASLNAWKAARAAWRDAHGWPADDLDYFREEFHERRRVQYGTPNPNPYIESERTE